MYLPASGQAVPPVSRLLFVPIGYAEQEREAENEQFPFSHAVQSVAVCCFHAACTYMTKSVTQSSVLGSPKTTEGELISHMKTP